MTHGKPRVLFEGFYSQNDLELDGLRFDVTPDGQRFLMLQDATDLSSGELKVVLNWVEELRRLVRARTYDLSGNN